MARKLTPDEYICQDCGYMGRANIKLRGSAVVEKLLWYVLVVPGPIYSWWRRQGSGVECAGCRDGHIVRLDSRLGAVLLENKLRGVTDSTSATPADPMARKPLPRKN